MFDYHDYGVLRLQWTECTYDYMLFSVCRSSRRQSAVSMMHSASSAISSRTAGSSMVVVLQKSPVPWLSARPLIKWVSLIIFPYEKLDCSICRHLWMLLLVHYSQYNALLFATCRRFRRWSSTLCELSATPWSAFQWLLQKTPVFTRFELLLTSSHSRWRRTTPVLALTAYARAPMVRTFVHLVKDRTSLKIVHNFDKAWLFSAWYGRASFAGAKSMKFCTFSRFEEGCFVIA